jgi:hypothetical protein
VAVPLVVVGVMVVVMMVVGMMVVVMMVVVMMVVGMMVVVMMVVGVMVIHDSLHLCGQQPSLETSPSHSLSVGLSCWLWNAKRSNDFFLRWDWPRKCTTNTIIIMIS